MLMWCYFAHKTTPHADYGDANCVWLLFDESVAAGRLRSQRRRLLAALADPHFQFGPRSPKVIPVL